MGRKWETFGREEGKAAVSGEGVDKMAEEGKDGAAAEEKDDAAGAPVISADETGVAMAVSQGGSDTMLSWPGERQKDLNQAW